MSPILKISTWPTYARKNVELEEFKEFKINQMNLRQKKAT